MSDVLTHTVPPLQTSAPSQGADERVVHIWDEPESRIKFLETMLKGREWEGIIYHPQMDPDANPRIHPLVETASQLNRCGYHTELGRDENGIPILSLKKFGNDTQLTDSMKQMGLVKGIGHKLSHIGEPLGKVISKSGKMLKYMVSDKARIIASSYLGGDVSLALADGKDFYKGPKGFAGAMATLQSLIFLGFAKPGNEDVYDDLMKVVQKSQKNGENILDKGVFERNESKSKGVVRFLKHSSIQIGSVVQMIGQLGMIYAGSKGLKENKANNVKGVKANFGHGLDIVTGITSMAGWGLFMRHGKEVPDDQKVSFKDHPLKWISQEITSNPSHFSSLVLTAASMTGLASALFRFDKNKITPKNKRGWSPNKPQTVAFLTYIVGDVVLAFAKSGHYSQDSKNDPKMLAQGLEQFMKDLPIVMGQGEQAELVATVSDYVASKTIQAKAKKEKREPAPGEEATLSRNIAENLVTKIPPMNERTHNVIRKIADIVEKFPVSQQREVSQAISEAISEFNGVSIRAHELHEHVGHHINAPEKQAEERSVSLKGVEKPVKELLNLFPNTSAQTVNRLYDSIGKYVHQDKVIGAHTADAVSRSRANGMQGQPVGVGH